MSNRTHCPTCLEPVAVPILAREGRCDLCRPAPRRRHRPDTDNGEPAYCQ
jgi:hypothetical protein